MVSGAKKNCRYHIHERVHFLVYFVVCLFVSRVSFRYCLRNVFVFPVFPIVLNLLCELPCGAMVYCAVSVRFYTIRGQVLKPLKMLQKTFEG